MKRLWALALCIAFLLCLSPCASAASLLEKPSAGQVIFLEADNDLDYTAGFPLSAVTGAFRDAADLRLEFPAAKLTLTGFFSPYGDWRRLYFSDGMSIGGADFDESGSFTGVYSYSSEFEKSGEMQSVPLAKPVTVEYTQSGLNVISDGQAAYGQLRQDSVAMAEQLSMYEKPDWQILKALKYEFYLSEDGALSPSKAYADFCDGISVECVNPQVAYISGSLSLVPLSEGRALLRYRNSLGDELLKLNVRCTAEENGQLQLSAPCDKCSSQQTGQLHMLICGHFSCQGAAASDGHAIAECSIAGHCALEGDHGRCKNCLEPLCVGQAHGFGICQHVHNWVPISIYTSRCVVCNYEYTSPSKSQG